MSLSTSDKMLKAEQKIARLERDLARERLGERKRDTRRKIEFGGLVVKAGMEGLPKDVILGALIHATQSLEKEEGARALFQSLGKASFENYG